MKRKGSVLVVLAVAVVIEFLWFHSGKAPEAVQVPEAQADEYKLNFLPFIAKNYDPSAATPTPAPTPTPVPSIGCGEEDTSVSLPKPVDETVSVAFRPDSKGTIWIRIFGTPDNSDEIGDSIFFSLDNGVTWEVFHVPSGQARVELTWVQLTYEDGGPVVLNEATVIVFRQREYGTQLEGVRLECAVVSCGEESTSVSLPAEVDKIIDITFDPDTTGTIWVYVYGTPDGSDEIGDSFRFNLNGGDWEIFHIPSGLAREQLHWVELTYEAGTPSVVIDKATIVAFRQREYGTQLEGVKLECSQ